MRTIETTKTEDQFIVAYFEAVDFTETGDDEQPPHGADLDPDFERESVIDCLAFFSRVRCYLSDDHIEQAGHDFWLTRNGHGTGFWDRPELYGETYAEMFTGMATGFGEAYPVFDEYI